MNGSRGLTDSWKRLTRIWRIKLEPTKMKLPQLIHLFPDISRKLVISRKCGLHLMDMSKVQMILHKTLSTGDGII